MGLLPAPFNCVGESRRRPEDQSSVLSAVYLGGMNKHAAVPMLTLIVASWASLALGVDASAEMSVLERIDKLEARVAQMDKLEARVAQLEAENDELRQRSTSPPLLRRRRIAHERSPYQSRASDLL